MAGKSLLKRLVLICISVVILAIVLVHLFVGRALKFGVETAGRRAMGVPVTVKKASLSVLRGNVSFRNLDIANPPGYTEPDLMSMDQVNVSANIASLLGDPAAIKRIDLDGVTIVIEQKDLTNNLQQVLNNLADGQANDKKADKDADKDADETEAKNLRIDVLEIRNVKVQVKLLPLPGRALGARLNLAPIRMTRLGTDSKLSMAKLLGKIMFAIAEGIAEQGTDLLPREIIGPMRSVLGTGGKALLETDTRAIEKGVDIGEDVGGVLEDIFKKKND